MLVLLLLACAPSRPTADPGWSGFAPVPAAVQENAVVVLNGELVVVGGFDADVEVVDTVWAYSPAADAWRELQRLPERLHHAHAAVVGGELVVLGTLGASGFGEVGTVLRYHSPSDTWSYGTPMPAELARGAGIAAVLGGRVHIVGGLQAGRSVGLHSAWDPETDSWEELAPALERDHLVGGTVNGKLVVTAGRAFGLTNVLSETQVYDPAADLWNPGAPIPTARGGAAGAVMNGELHVIGGEGNIDDKEGMFWQHESYDPIANTWTEHGAMLTPRHGTGAAVVDGVLWMPGGATKEGFHAVATHEGWTP